MILSDHELTKWAENGGISHASFVVGNVNPASIDLRIGDEFIMLAESTSTRLRRTFSYSSPKPGSVFCASNLMLRRGDAVLATTVEYINMPSDCAGVLYLKSSAARAGLDHALAGFVDPGFSWAANYGVACTPRL